MTNPRPEGKRTAYDDNLNFNRNFPRDKRGQFEFYRKEDPSLTWERFCLASAAIETGNRYLMDAFINGMEVRPLTRWQRFVRWLQWS